MWLWLWTSLFFNMSPHWADIGQWCSQPQTKGCWHPLQHKSTVLNPSRNIPNSVGLKTSRNRHMPISNLNFQLQTRRERSQACRAQDTYQCVQRENADRWNTQARDQHTEQSCLEVDGADAKVSQCDFEADILQRWYESSLNLGWTVMLFQKNVVIPFSGLISCLLWNYCNVKYTETPHVLSFFWKRSQFREISVFVLQFEF
jgi:hypothetical protein